MSDKNLVKCPTLDELSEMQQYPDWGNKISLTVWEETMTNDTDKRSLEIIKEKSFSTIKEVADFLEANYSELVWGHTYLRDLSPDSWRVVEAEQDKDGVFIRHTVSLKGASTDEIRALSRKLSNYDYMYY